jgi:aryl-alcohol dehydrogenase-like predicted oxidoreductase
MTYDASRRAFLRLAAAAAALAASGRSRSASADPQSTGEVPRGPAGGGPRPDAFKLRPGATMPLRQLGRTGVQVSLLGLGGYHLGVPSEAEAMRMVHEAMDHGVTFFDNCWDYNGGESERRLGKALQGSARQRAFVMTKIDGRTARGATEQLDQSLRRLRTDHVDLLQIHEVIRPTDPARVFASGGAIEALVRARKAGKIRFIGFTGHKSPAIHLTMLDTARTLDFRFDAVQMPLNVMDAQYDSFEAGVLPVLEREQIGVLGMKPMGGGLLLESGAVSAVDCLRYAMSLPTSVVITGCDSIGVLRQALHTALAFEPFNQYEWHTLLARTAQAASTGHYEQYKMSQRFDGTTRHPEWLD